MSQKLALISLAASVAQCTIRELESPQIGLDRVIPNKPLGWLRAFLFENFLGLRSVFNIVNVGICVANVIELKDTSSKNFTSIAAIGAASITALAYLIDRYQKQKVAAWQADSSSDMSIRWHHPNEDHYFSAARMGVTLASFSHPALRLLDLAL